jgi:Tol biopolymer transport system component
MGHLAMTRLASRAVVLGICSVGAEGCAAPEAEPAAVAEPPAGPAPLVLALEYGLPRGVLGRLVFHSDREGRHRLFEVELPTGRVRRLTTGVLNHDEEAAPSPNARMLAFSTTRFDARSFDLALVDTTTGQIRQVTSRLDYDSHPAWLPDGRHLVFTSDADGAQAIYRWSMDTSETERISAAPDRSLMPAVSPDGERLAYVQGGRDGLRVVVQDLGSAATTAVSLPGVATADPAWSPDGRLLAYARLTGRTSDIEVLNPATGGVRRIAIDGVSTVREPAWSPDGRWIAAAMTRGRGAREDWDLVLIPVDAVAAAVVVTRGHGNDRAPAWLSR